MRPSFAPSVRSVLRSATLLTAVTAAGSAFAQQGPTYQVIDFFVCESDDCSDTSTNGVYFGLGQDAQFEDTSSVAGAIYEASASDDFTGDDAVDAYDGWGAIYGVPDGASVRDGNNAYATPFNGLENNRSTETYVTQSALPANTVRWFDEFTNTSSEPITVNLAFSGNLGSDSDTNLLRTGAGYFVTGDGYGSDPVIAHIYGNNAFADAATVNVVANDDNPYILYETITVAPGETVSLMHYNALVADADRDTNFDEDDPIYQAEADEAERVAMAFLNSPVFEGLSADQIATLLNWDVAAVEAVMERMDAGAARASAAIIGGFLFRPSGDQSVMANAEVTRFSPVNNGTASFYVLAGGALGQVDGTDFDATYFGAGATLDTGALSYGGALVSTSGDTDTERGASSKGITGFAFAEYDPGAALILRGALAYGVSEQAYSRTAGAGVAMGETDSTTTTLGLYAGYRLATQAVAEFVPYAAITHTIINYDGFAETGAGLLNTTYADFEETNTLYELGIRASQQFGEITYYGGAALALNETTGGSAVSTVGATGAPGTSDLSAFSDSSQLMIEAGLSAPLGSAVSGNLGYRGYLGEDDNVHTLEAALKFSF
jgi:hypothetical protein